MKINSTNNNGSILVVTLWIVSLLSLFAFGLTSITRLSIRQERAFQDEAAARAQLLGLAEMALLRLRNDNELEVDAPGEEWARSYTVTSDSLIPGFEFNTADAGSMEMSIVAVDESRKVNVNLASEAVLTEVLREVGFESNAQRVAEAIIDWRDADNEGLAEGDHYATGERSYVPPNADLLHIEEALFIDGVTTVLFWGEDANYNGHLDPQEDDSDIYEPMDNSDGRLQPGLIDVLTTYGDGSININGVSPFVLRALFRVELSVSEAEELARAILSRRAGPDRIDGTDDDRPFTSDEEIVDAIGAPYGQLLRAGIEFRTSSEAFRLFLRVHDPDSYMTLEGDMVVVREDGALVVKEWHLT